MNSWRVLNSYIKYFFHLVPTWVDVCFCIDGCFGPSKQARTSLHFNIRAMDIKIIMEKRMFVGDWRKFILDGVKRERKRRFA